MPKLSLLKTFTLKISTRITFIRYLKKNQNSIYIQFKSNHSFHTTTLFKYEKNCTISNPCLYKRTQSQSSNDQFKNFFSRISRMHNKCTAAAKCKKKKYRKKKNETPKGKVEKMWRRQKKPAGKMKKKKNSPPRGERGAFDYSRLNAPSPLAREVQLFRPLSSAGSFRALPTMDFPSGTTFFPPSSAFALAHFWGSNERRSTSGARDRILTDPIIPKLIKYRPYYVLLLPWITLIVKLLLVKK